MRPSQLRAIPSHKDDLVDELRPGSGWWTEGGRSLTERFASAQGIDDGAIQDFLDHTPLFGDDRRWTQLDSICGEGSSQYEDTVSIINAIISRFHGNLSARRAMVTSDRELNCECNIGHLTPGQAFQGTPEAMIVGSGGVVSRATALASDAELEPNYSICVTPVLFQYGKDPEDEDALQLGIYAREAYVQCQNREHVYGLLMTESWVQLIKYDCEGLMRSDSINIHDDAPTFIRIVAGVSSPDDKFVGYNTAVRWVGTERILVLPSLTKPLKHGDQPRRQEVFRIERVDGKLKPLLLRRTMHGRGTICWLVRNDRGSILVARFAWRRSNHTDEWGFLRAAAGLPGVGQTYAYCDNLSRISESRFWDHSANRTDSILYCVIMHPYYGPVFSFKRPSQLLWGFHDAIKGHLNLLKRGILHRDISDSNVLLGVTDEPGERGVLIDFDRAAFVGEDKRAPPRLRIGTRHFMSTQVVIGGGHDHWDDLESLFYVIVFTLATSKKVGANFVRSRCGDALPMELDKLDDPDDYVAMQAKEHLLCTEAEHHDFFEGKAAEDFLELIDDLRAVVQKYRTDWKLRCARPADAALSNDSQMSRLEAQYEEFLNPIRNAIKLYEWREMDERMVWRRRNTAYLGKRGPAASPPLSTRIEKRHRSQESSGPSKRIRASSSNKAAVPADDAPLTKGECDQHGTPNTSSMD